jgi:hypothetical protein
MLITTHIHSTRPLQRTMASTMWRNVGFAIKETWVECGAC